MKKLYWILPVVAMCLLLNGCGFFFPFFYLNFSAPTQETVSETLPVGSDVDPKLSAEDIYWRSKLAISTRATQYQEKAEISLISTDETAFQSNLFYDIIVSLDPGQSAVNVQTQFHFDHEKPQEYWDYYRDEDGKLIYYYHETETGDCSREEIPLEDSTTYAIILDFSVYGQPYGLTDLQVEPQTRMLNDREVYVLPFRQSALEALGYTGNTLVDEQLSKREISGYWYVDAETFYPVRTEYSVVKMDDVLGESISSSFSLDLNQMDVAITSFHVTRDYLSFDPVELPEIPEEVWKKAWEGAGFSAN